MLHVLWTVTILKCPYIPKVFIYTIAVKMFIINLIVRKSSPHPPLPPAPKVGLHAQLINKNKNKFTVASQLLHLMQKGNKNKTAKQRKGGRGGSTVPMLLSPDTKFTEYLFNMHKPPFGHKSL